EGIKKSWSNFRRFTYFVSKSQTNKTFRDRVGGCNYTSLEIIKDAFSVEKENKELIEAGKSVKKAYADFTNQVLQADSSQTIQGLQITILASLKSLKKSIK
ncbi:hypothetical protein LCGC14_2925500, partial [marine sediment metagenome]